MAPDRGPGAVVDLFEDTERLIAAKAEGLDPAAWAPINADGLAWSVIAEDMAAGRRAWDLTLLLTGLADLVRQVRLARGDDADLWTRETTILRLRDRRVQPKRPPTSRRSLRAGDGE
jgi:hypothetical protein